MQGAFCDLLWSDPVDDKDSDMVKEYSYNNDRDCSFVFGKAAAKKLLDANSLVSIIRGHQVQLDGYKMHRFTPPASGAGTNRSVVSSIGGSGSSSTEFPSVVTIFSAPNYCGTYDNKGAYFLVENGSVKVKQFNETPAPYDLPEGYNAFNWSVPFIGDRILDMFNNILQQVMKNKQSKYRKKGIHTFSDDEQEETKESKNKEESKTHIDMVFKDFAEKQAKEEAEKKGAMLRKKVRAMGRMGKIYSTLKDEHVFLLKLK